MSNPVARDLRRYMTKAELLLWYQLRDRRLSDCKFRRQHPIGPFVVDFACVEKSLIIEVDGGQHAESERDASRTKWLEDHGWRVLRFWNHDVLHQTETVLEGIRNAVGGRKHPHPALRADLSRDAGEV
jgi:primosomal protein N' (replication factor Y)